MKGKYAAKAEKRREVTEAEVRAGAAELALVKVTAELDAYREKAEGEIERLKERLADAVDQRDSATSPQVADLVQRNAEMSAQLKDATAEAAKIRRSSGELFHFTAKLLHNLTGCTGLEAVECIVAGFKDIEPISITDAKTGVANADRLSPGEAEAIQRVRGWRSAPAVIEHLNSLVDSARGRGE